MNNPSLNNDPIDAVITWVDGNDPKHIEKRSKYKDEIDLETTGCANLEGRFVQVNEVKYCIYSIRKFAPWIRNIFLVTDEQCPDWLTDDLKKELGVTIIDHKVIFRDHLQYLPTFNTRSINKMLWRIPDLAEKFLVFDDDCFLINQVYPEDFFIGEKTVLRGIWSPSRLSLGKKIKHTIKHFLKYKGIKFHPWKRYCHYINGAKLIGFEDRYFELFHAPFTAKRSVLEEFYTKNPKILEQNIRYRFRNKFQTTSSVIFTHLTLKNNKAVIKDDTNTLLIIPKKGGLTKDRYKFDLIKNGKSNIKFLCFQDLYFLKQENSHEFAEVIDYLEKTIMPNQSRKI